MATHLDLARSRVNDDLAIGHRLSVSSRTATAAWSVSQAHTPLSRNCDSQQGLQHGHSQIGHARRQKLVTEIVRVDITITMIERGEPRWRRLRRLPRDAPACRHRSPGAVLGVASCRVGVLEDRGGPFVLTAFARTYHARRRRAIQRD